jgi:plastocyanin domain-containing protein
MVGLLNGLMPCGPLQTMQLYALGTGSFVAGAFSMLLFSLGTVPLMFAFGAISSILSSKFTKKLMWVSAALVMVLGVIMVGRGFSQSGISVAFANDAISSIARVEENVQLVSTDMEPNVYEPIAVQVGIPVRWTINVEEGDLNGCNNPIAIPKYGVEQKLEIGENIIEFTPTSEGNIVYTCWMGMISGNIMAVSDVSVISAEEVEREAFEEKQIYLNQDSVDLRNSSANSNGERSDSASASADDIAIATIEGGIQTVRMDVNELGFSPALIVMQKDIETKWAIVGENLDGCNNSLIFPVYNFQLDLEPGENMMEFTPTQDFSFSCWMGMINGYVKVVDDINSIDLEQIKSEVSTFVSPNSGGCCG